MASLILKRLDLDVFFRGIIAAPHVSYEMFEPNIQTAMTLVKLLFSMAMRWLQFNHQKSVRLYL